ncbi:MULTISPECIES: porin [Cupriavidus]|uniref:Porin n=1 Tax=Cupriavidus metallidurans TaxID=119219 RepID=A0A482IXX5_9BURK|nr:MULTISPECIES: porin [Cupriavidus]KWR71446.1 hypothetical protein RN01_31730 [Cupriavidus sp. SHE]QBP13818.1 porin [Cupriavidus metallidurans]QWC91593.1 porin [Cupriavidus metallidurans]
MKKIFFATAVLGAMGTAHAQSSVTLYGVADANIEYVSHLGSQPPTPANGFNAGQGGNTWRLTSGGLSSSRWGLRGVEDLGSGTKAVYVLESGFSIDNGVQSQGRLFGRQAYVGLDSRYGQFLFGRQYTSLFHIMANYSPTAYAVQYEPVVAFAGANLREDNTAKYIGTFGPVTAIAHWSFGTGVALPGTSLGAPSVGGNGEVPGQFRRDSAYGLGAEYAAGPFGVAVAYDQYNPSLSSAAGAFVGTGSFKKATIGASYTLGATAKIMGGYRWGQNKAQDGSTLILRDDFFWIGGNYQVTPALGLTLEYNYDNVKNLLGQTHLANPWQVSFIADYTLSKRTDLYLTTAFSKNAGLNFDTSAISFANGYFLASGQSTMLGVALGVRHKF